MLPLREIDRGVVDLRDRPPVRQHRAVGLKFIHRHLHVGDEPHRRVCHAGLSGGEMIGGDALAERDHQQVEQIERDPFLPIRTGRRAVGKAHAQINARIFPQSRLAQIGGGHAHVLEGGEKFPIVEQREQQPA